MSSCNSHLCAWLGIHHDDIICNTHACKPHQDAQGERPTVKDKYMTPTMSTQTIRQQERSVACFGFKDVHSADHSALRVKAASQGVMGHSLASKPSRIGHVLPTAAANLSIFRFTACCRAACDLAICSGVNAEAAPD